MLRRRLNIEQRSDEELIRLYKLKQDNRFLGQLLDRHLHKLYGLCLKYMKNQQDAEDAAMEIYASLPDKLQQYEIENFSAWLFFVSKNHCLKRLKQNAKIRTELLEENSEDLFVENPLEETLYSEEKRLEKLSNAIDQLKEGQKECIILFYLEQKSYQDIAQMNGYTEKQVKSHIQNGKRNLKNLILNSK
jgi:RNA polymerase sigma-70 factor (ECF subfamily)